MRSEFSVGERPMGPGHPCFVIAEVGSNHNRSLSLARELIAAAAEAGADAVKFQSQKLEEQYVPARESAEFIEFFRTTELPEDWYPELASAARKHGVIFFSSPTYLGAVELLEAAGVPLFKIASPQAATYPALVRRVARTGKPMILSAGLVGYEGLTGLLRLCEEERNDRVAVLHCVSKYPTPPAGANLRTMATYRAMFGCPVGFSDHTLGHHVALAAVALGASVLEKHITLDRGLPGPDHAFALEPAEFGAMLRELREVEASVGHGVRLEVEPELREFVERIDVRLVAAREIAAGTPLLAELFVHRRTGTGVPVSELARLRGAVAAATIPAGTPLGWELVRFGGGGAVRCD